MITTGETKTALCLDCGEIVYGFQGVDDSICPVCGGELWWGTTYYLENTGRNAPAKDHGDFPK